jgi:hypothetical protein
MGKIVDYRLVSHFYFYVKNDKGDWYAIYNPSSGTIGNDLLEIDKAANMPAAAAYTKLPTETVYNG